MPRERTRDRRGPRAAPAAVRAPGRTWSRPRPRRGAARSRGRRAARSPRLRTCRRCRAWSRRARAPLDRRHGLGLVGGGVEGRHPHAAEAELGNLEPVAETCAGPQAHSARRSGCLEQLADAGEELGSLGAVEDAVVAGERDRPSARPRANSPSRTTGRWGDRADGEDRRLRRVDHRARSCVTPYMPRFETVNVPPAELWRGDRRRRGRARRARRDSARDLPQRPCGRRRRPSARRARRGRRPRCPTLTRAVELEAAVAVRAVGARELAQGERRTPSPPCR